MRRRPIVPGWAPVLDLEPALHLYCEKRKVDFGVLYRNRYVRVWSGRNITAAGARLTFGRKHAFWQVQAWTFAGPGDEDRLYNNLTRALDRKLRELGWLTTTSSDGLRAAPTRSSARSPASNVLSRPTRRRWPSTRSG